MSEKRAQLWRRIRNYLPHLPGDIFKAAVILIFLFPFYWMFITSFKTYSEAILTPPTLWPQNFTLENFINISQMDVDLTRYTLNTIIITGSVIVMQLLIMVPAAYAFAKIRFRGQGVLFSIVLIAFMIPGQITYISVYLMMANAGLINTLWPQILPFGANAFGIFMLRQAFKQIPDEIIESAKLDSANSVQIMAQIMLPMCLPFGANAFGIFMLRQAFKQIPDEIIESAKLDSANSVQIMAQIMLPMCKSSMITIAMFSFISHWNSYFWPLVMTQSEKVRPLTMAIEKIKDAEYGIQWNTIMAANSILVIPVLIVFLFASKKIIQAFAYRGMK